MTSVREILIQILISIQRESGPEDESGIKMLVKGRFSEQSPVTQSLPRMHFLHFPFVELSEIRSNKLLFLCCTDFNLLLFIWSVTLILRLWLGSKLICLQFLAELKCVFKPDVYTWISPAFVKLSGFKREGKFIHNATFTDKATEEKQINSKSDTRTPRGRMHSYPKASALPFRPALNLWIQNKE